jgi:hypothetical protein
MLQWFSGRNARMKMQVFSPEYVPIFHTNFGFIDEATNDGKQKKKLKNGA